MIKFKLTLVILLLLSSALTRGADLKITWKEGKDNLYNQAAVKFTLKACIDEKCSD